MIAGAGVLSSESPDPVMARLVDKLTGPATIATLKTKDAGLNTNASLARNASSFCGLPAWLPPGHRQSRANTGLGTKPFRPRCLASTEVVRC